VALIVTLGQLQHARSCPPSTIGAALGAPWWGRKTRAKPRAEGLHSPGRGEQSSSMALCHRTHRPVRPRRRTARRPMASPIKDAPAPTEARPPPPPGPPAACSPPLAAPTPSLSSQPTGSRPQKPAPPGHSHRRLGITAAMGFDPGPAGSPLAPCQGPSPPNKDPIYSLFRPPPAGARGASAPACFLPPTAVAGRLASTCCAEPRWLKAAAGRARAFTKLRSGQCLPTGERGPDRHAAARTARQDGCQTQLKPSKGDCN